MTHVSADQLIWERQGMSSCAKEDKCCKLEERQCCLSIPRPNGPLRITQRHQPLNNGELSPQNVCSQLSLSEPEQREGAYISCADKWKDIMHDLSS